MHSRIEADEEETKKRQDELAANIAAQEADLKKNIGTIQKTIGKIDALNNKKLAQMQQVI